MELINKLNLFSLVFILIGLTFWYFGFSAILKRERKLRYIWDWYAGIDFFINLIMGERNLRGSKAIIAGIIYLLTGLIMFTIAFRSINSEKLNNQPKNIPSYLAPYQNIIKNSSLNFGNP